MVLLATVFLAGLAGSAQCIGLCGALPFTLGQAPGRLGMFHVRQGLYYTGKAAAYALLGALAGGFGALIGVKLYGLQSVLGMVAGFAVAVVGYGMTRPQECPTAAPPRGFFGRLSAGISLLLYRATTPVRRTLQVGSLPGVLTLGLLNGLLPCALVYAMLVKAAGEGSAAGGALVMGLFGLATVPALYAFSALGKLVRPTWRTRVVFFSGLLLISLGTLGMVRSAGVFVRTTRDVLDQYYITDWFRAHLSDSFVKFEKVILDGTEGRFTSVAVGPDGRLYALYVTGEVYRWNIKPDGTLDQKEVLDGIPKAEGQPRLPIGLTFDPASRPDSVVVWVTHTTFGFEGVPDWGGKITRLSGPKLEHVQDVVVRLPRSHRDHLTNGLAFGPDGALYVNQGASTSTGAPDSVWAWRKEHLLTAAVLRVDVRKILASGKLPLDVKTEEDGHYNPYAPGAPVQVFASGVRNAYDLVWHSNGKLYVPINGPAATGNAPASVPGGRRLDGTPYAGPAVPALHNVPAQPDYLIMVPPPRPDGTWPYRYYGHPNPARGEFALNGANPTAGPDPAEISMYPVGTKPDPNFVGFAANLGDHASANGVIEYQSDTFGGILKGKLLVVRYSVQDDILVLDPKDGGEKVPISKLDVIGFKHFSDPLDLTENPRDGSIYVADFANKGHILLLRPMDFGKSLASAH